MNDQQWMLFFQSAAEVLGEGSPSIDSSPNWCSWTTFRRLESDAGYWQAGLPARAELLSNSTTDGGVWGQPFSYQDIAHLIIPRIFTRELFSGAGADRKLEFVRVEQKIAELSALLARHNIPHSLGHVALEVRCL